MKGEGKSIFGKSALIVMLSFTANGLGPAYAQGEKDFVVSLDPAARYSFVKGDEEKFRVHHWAKENFVGGVQDFSLKKENLAGDLSLFMEGHALVDENDLKGSLRLDRGELGFIRFDYEEFSRFYEGTGGVYRRFNALRVNELEEELELEIGRLAVEAVLTFENFPELGFLYERRFKDGAKSRLTW
ncbi:MAG: hypothetical protein HY593_06240, partial [Candidatus Omnitrophica bacterium]|nr:hypothetical protein [Candidatus Omnitrophota bacterium]